MKTLITGFEPFGGSDVNTSQLIADALGGVVLPVSYARAADALRAAVREAHPDVVICFGQADREAVSVERFALNFDGSESADNDGFVSDAEIDPGGPVAYRSTLPVDEIVEALRMEDIPAEASRTAGGFLCNHVFYALMQLIERERPEMRGGFVHVPETMPEDDAVHAGAIVVGCCSQQPAAASIKEGAGSAGSRSTHEPSRCESAGFRTACQTAPRASHFL